MQIYSMIYVLTLFILLVTASIYDLRKRIVPNKLVVLGMLLGSLFNVLAVFLFNEIELREILLNMIGGFLAGGIPFIAAELFGRALTKKQGIGAGDIKLYAMSGMFLGFWLILNSFIVLAVLSLAGILIMAICKKIKKGDYIPYAPFISAAVFITLNIGIKQHFLICL